MKIALIASLFAPYKAGGAETIVQHVAYGLQKHGHEVFVITTKPFMKGIQSEVINGLNVLRFFPLNIFWVGNISRKNMIERFIWHIKDTFNIFSFFKIRSLLKKIQPDMVMSHNLKGIGYLTPLAIKSLGMPYIHTVHDVQLYTPSGLIIHGKENAWEHTNLLTRMYRVICRKLFQACDTVIFPSNFLKNFYTEHGFFQSAKKIVLINPIIERIAVAKAENPKKFYE